jgi:iron complex outermembrane receptor protein
MRNLLLFLFIILTKSVVAAEFSSTQLSGRVLDNERKPVEYAVVTLLKAEDSTLVKGAESGADGSFVLDGFAGGNYLLNVSFSGYMKQMLGPMDIAEG